MARRRFPTTPTISPGERFSSRAFLEVRVMMLSVLASLIDFLFLVCVCGGGGV